MSTQLDLPDLDICYKLERMVGIILVIREVRILLDQL